MKLHAKGRQYATLFAILAVVFVSAGIGGSSARADSTITVCASGCDYTTISDAVGAASSGDTIDVTGDFALSSTVNVSQPITIQGESGATITANGLSSAFSVTAKATIGGFSFSAPAHTTNNGFISLLPGANDSTITGNHFTGGYSLGDSEVTRGVVVSPGVTGLSITDNHFESIRQPAYLDNGDTGTISGNYAAGTRGWVVGAQSSLSFSGNTWGSGSDRNAVDIAIITNASTSDSYSDVMALSQANDNAVVDNQYEHTMSSVYVDASASGGGNGYWNSPFQTIQAGIEATVTGGTVNVAGGQYVEDVKVDKSVTLVSEDGANSTTIVATDANATPLQFSASNATVDGFKVTHDYTQPELDAWNFNNNGVLFNQTYTGNTLKNSVVTLNRNGVYINTTRGNSLVDNTITNNRTGINMTGDFTGTTITGNTISANWTEGLVLYGTNSPGIDLSSVTLSGNTFNSNWYEEIEIKSPNSTSTSTFTGALDVTNNTFSDNPVMFSTSDDAGFNEPGFADQKPASLGGSAAAPTAVLPTLRIYGTPNATLQYNNPKTDCGVSVCVVPAPPSNGGGGNTNTTTNTGGGTPPATTGTTTTGTATTTVTPTSVAVIQTGTNQEATAHDVQPTQTGTASVVVAPTTGGTTALPPVSVQTTWPANTFTVPVTVVVTPQPGLSAPTAGNPNPPAVAGGLAVGNTVVQIVATKSSGQKVTVLAEPLQVHIASAPGNYVPAFSEDGKTWSTIPRIYNLPLPDGQSDGYFVNTDGSIDIYTRHLTYFGLLKDVQAPTIKNVKAHRVGSKLYITTHATDNVRVGYYLVSITGQKTFKTAHAYVARKIRKGQRLTVRVTAVDTAGNKKVSAAVKVR